MCSSDLMVNYPTGKVILTGGPECVILEYGWDNEPRVVRTSGKWSIRETLTMAQRVDLVIGPETGVLNSVAAEPVPKIVFLSHYTHENLTRDWVNVTPLASPNTTCAGRGANEAPACHMLHFGWANCTRDEETGTAQCQKDIPVGEVWSAVESVISKVG